MERTFGYNLDIRNATRCVTTRGVTSLIRRLVCLLYPIFLSAPSVKYAHVTKAIVPGVAHASTNTIKHGANETKIVICLSQQRANENDIIAILKRLVSCIVSMLEYGEKEIESISEHMIESAILFVWRVVLRPGTIESIPRDLGTFDQWSISVKFAQHTAKTIERKFERMVDRLLTNNGMHSKQSTAIAVCVAGK